MSPASHVKNASAPQPTAFMPRRDALMPMGIAKPSEMPSSMAVNMMGPMPAIPPCTVITQTSLWIIPQEGELVLMTNHQHRANEGTYRRESRGRHQQHTYSLSVTAPHL